MAYDIDRETLIHSCCCDEYINQSLWLFLSPQDEFIFANEETSATESIVDTTIIRCAIVMLISIMYTTTILALNHWGRMTHICVGNLIIIGSDNGLSPGRRQAIIWTIAGILLIRSLRIKFSEVLNKIHAFSFTKMHLNCRMRKGSHFVLALMC